MARAAGMSQPPPPRYRIIEKDGRLVTIDTWATRGVPPLPGSPAIPKADSRRASPSTGQRVGQVPGLPEKLVAALLRVQDDDGRRLLTTGPNWDRKGPRVIALSPVGEKRLGTALAAAGIVLAVAVLLALSDLDWFFPIVIIGVVLGSSASTAGMPLVTRFLDSLGEDVTR